ncbi:MAG TPA: hypothetical protein VFC09_11980 [Candidatus Dormibacteraeota bacterium]|nr:hypothetical protein [Candidatus Dormibacteraeota bacterium]
MHYVVLGVHSPEICPTSNAKTRALLLELGPQIPGIAEKNSVKIVAGPYVNREHTTVVIVETDSAENLDAFLVQARLHQWNQLRILPSQHMAEGMKDVAEGTSLF